jgi:glyoxylase-like metal-dependent hydrolase (beta-lactamase superfamily II)
MHEVAPDVFQLRSFPNNSINVYIIGDVLIDAGTRMARPGILRQIKGRKITAHSLTHVHADHQGASKAICETLNIPLYCGKADTPAMESGSMEKQIPRNVVTRLFDVIWTGPGYPVARSLSEGDEVAGFTVIDVPGHSPGHIAYWRERDRVLILGDVIANLNFLTFQTQLVEPPTIFTLNPVQNRASARKLAALHPRIVCFGHGKPLYDGAKFVDFVERLPV